MVNGETLYIYIPQGTLLTALISCTEYLLTCLEPHNKKERARCGVARLERRLPATARLTATRVRACACD